MCYTRSHHSGVVGRVLRSTYADDARVDPPGYRNCMHWTRWERAILDKINRYPRSTTPRERTMLLLTIRLGLLGMTACALGLLLLSVEPLVGWNPLTAA